MYILLRVIHVVFGAVWVGMALSSAVFVLPILGLTGPDAGRIMGRLQSRVWVLPVIATLTILSGVWLFWRRGYMGPAGGTQPAMALGAGGVLGIVAYIIGATVISRSMAKATSLGAQIDSAAPAEKAAIVAQIGALRQRAISATRLVAVLLVVTVLLMAIGVSYTL